MNRSTSVLIATCVLGLAGLVSLPLLTVMVAMGGSVDPSNSCDRSGDETVLVSGRTASELSAGQRRIAGVVISAGRAAGHEDRAIVVALAVASQESGFKNYANDGVGDDLAPDQRGIERSLQLPHDAVGSDHGSLGVFQQQWPWWGSMRELMDPRAAADKFYAALRKVAGWEEMGIGEAAQAVQRSAHPNAYDDDVQMAEQLLADAGGTDTVTEASYYGSTADCAFTLLDGAVVMPVAGSSYVDSKNFGRRGLRWSKAHTGTDLSALCGTSVLASTGGVVTVRTDQAWSGRWLVTIDAGQGSVVTWYGHMQSIQVATGDTVSAGQPVGSVGSEGNSTGCHLHFEVRPDGGDPVDPSVWLAQNVGTTVPVSKTTASASAVIMTANIPRELSKEKAGRRLGRLLEKDPDVLLIQEVRKRDIAAMAGRTDGRWGVWQPSGARGDNAIVWDRKQFSLVRRGSELGVDMGDRQRWMSWVLLESQAGALPVVTLHMPQDAATDPDQARHYRSMTQSYLELISELNEKGFPPIVGGDWSAALDRSSVSWGPVRELQRVGMTTNWVQSTPCASTDDKNRRSDGFAFNPDYVAVADQGCLDGGPSGQRPVWIAVRPAG